MRYNMNILLTYLLTDVQARRRRNMRAELCHHCDVIRSRGVISDVAI